MEGNMEMMGKNAGGEAFFIELKEEDSENHDFNVDQRTQQLRIEWRQKFMSLPFVRGVSVRKFGNGDNTNTVPTIVLRVGNDFEGWDMMPQFFENMNTCEHGNAANESNESTNTSSDNMSESCSERMFGEFFLMDNGHHVMVNGQNVRVRLVKKTEHDHIPSLAPPSNFIGQLRSNTQVNVE